MQRSNRTETRSNAGAKRAPAVWRQTGAIIPVVVIAMVALLAMMGLTLDSAHGLLNKSKLQNSVDAAALAGAKVLWEDEDTVLAEAEARAVFGLNADDAGNSEINDSYDSNEMSLTVQFSEELDPFTPGTTPANFIRVRATGLDLPAWFIRILGFNTKTVAASAVAGPSPSLRNVCNVAPMMVCGEADTDPDDDNYWGYELDAPQVLKTTASGGDFEIGPGNFQLIRLEDAQGGADIREAMAGSYDACLADDENIDTEPGNTVGPSVQGINTRFGIYSGPVSAADYPPDEVTEFGNPPLTYEDMDSDGDDEIVYADEDGDVEITSANIDDPDYDIFTHDDYDNWAGPTQVGGVEGRRILAVPVGMCDGTTNGQGQVELLAVLCFHLLQPASQHGQESHIFGQFVGPDCNANGDAGPDPDDGPGVVTFYLYKDPDSTAS